MMESVRNSRLEDRHRLSEMRESKTETRHTDGINGSNGARLSAPLAVYPFQRIRDSNLAEEEERRLSDLHRPVITRISNTTANSRRTFKTYTINEILKNNETSPERESYEDSRRTHRISLDRHCLSSSRESLVRERCWCYDDGANSQQCTTCCQCYSSYRYPYAMPLRTWHFAGDREALQCGFTSTGMSNKNFCTYILSLNFLVCLLEFPL